MLENVLNLALVEGVRLVWQPLHMGEGKAEAGCSALSYNSSATGIADRPRGQGWIGRPGQKPINCKAELPPRKLLYNVGLSKLSSRKIKDNG